MEVSSGIALKRDREEQTLRQNTELERKIQELSLYKEIQTKKECIFKVYDNAKSIINCETSVRNGLL